MRKFLLLCILTCLFSGVLPAQPVAFFEVDVEEGCVPLTVNITATDWPEILEHNWDFGNGQTSVLAFPQPITYLVPGEFEICHTILIDAPEPITDVFCDTITVNEVPQDVEAIAIGEVSCTNPQAQLQASTSSAGSGITYAWTGPSGFISNEMNPIVNEPGSYILVVTNALGCTDSDVAVVPVAGDYVQLDCIITDISCNGDIDGGLDLVVIGGTSPYTYLWSNGMNTEDITNLAPGVYSVTVVDFEGCENTEIYEVEEPTAIEIFETVNNVSCFGSTNGSIDIEVSGGTPPYIYEWNMGAITEDVSLLPAGIFTVTVTDANNCTATNSYTITEPSEAISLSMTTTNLTCTGDCTGGVVFNVTGGCAPYTIEVFDSNNNPVDPIELCEDVYTVVVTDCEGCIFSSTFTIDQPEELQLSYTTECETATSGGSIDLMVTGGTPPYLYTWANMVGGNATVTDLLTGTYSVTIQDANGCEISEEIEIGDAILGTTPDQDATICEGTDIQFFVDAPTAVSYSWEPTIGLSCSDCPNPTLLADLGGPTFYTVTVVEADGCIDVAHFNFNIQSYLDFNLLEFSNAPLFPGETLELYCNVFGASSVNWSGPGNFSSDICEPTIENVGLGNEGSYTVDIVDGNGCEVNATVDVEIYELIEGISADTVICEGGSTSLVVMTSPDVVSYTWTPTTGLSCTDCASPIASPENTTLYSVTVENGSGTQETASVMVEVEEQVVIAITPTVEVCDGEDFGGCADLGLTNPGGSFFWSGPNGYFSTDTCFFIEDPSPDMYGCYILSYTSAAGCVYEDEVCITNGSPTINFISPDTTICAGESVELTVSAPTGMLEYAWTPEGSLDCGNCSTVIASPLTTTNYEVSIIDLATGCITVGNILVTVDEGCVWPGDTDTNKVVNNFDLLNIGLAFDSIGPVRPDASLTWSGQPASDWTQNTPNNVNYKHIDTNGDGMINADDTLAINLNWGEMHNLTGGDDPQLTSFNPYPQSTISLTAPFYVQTDTLQAGETVALPVILGEESNPAEDIYGLAFSLEYDTTVVVPGSAYMRFTDSWLGEDLQDMITIQKTFAGPGRVDIGMTRIDGLPMTGFGQLSEIIITIEDDILFRDNSDDDSRNGVAVDALFTISNVLMINQLGEEIEVTPQQTSAVVESTVSVYSPEVDVAVQLHPNPAQEITYLRTTPQIKLMQIQLYNLTGQLVQTIIPQGLMTPISVQDLPPGTYLLKVRAEQGTALKRLIILR